MTGLAATIGVGNIAGVATAIITGGPGALFWIWCYGLIATAMKFTEARLGPEVPHRPRRADAGRPDVLPARRAGLAGAGLDLRLIAGVACLFTTPFTQPNSIAVVLDSQFKQHAVEPQHVDDRRRRDQPQPSGDRRRARGAHLAGDHRRREVDWPRRRKALAVQGRLLPDRRADRDRDAHRAIAGGAGVVFHDAFSLETVAGTTVGGSWAPSWAALRYGLARGAYANEAGYGTAAVVYGVAKSNRPDQQGLNAVMEVFIITFVTSHDQRADDSAHRHVEARGRRKRRRRVRGVQLRDPRRRRLDGRVLGVPVRLHDAHGLVVLRRAVPGVSLRRRASSCPTAGCTAC